MSIFQELENQLYYLGILQWGPTPRAQRITIILNLIIFATLMSFTISTTWFLLFEAQTPGEKTEAIHCILASLLLLAWYLNFIVKRQEYTAIVIELVDMIEKSK